MLTGKSPVEIELPQDHGRSIKPGTDLQGSNACT
jgi:hypothetical protein